MAIRAIMPPQFRATAEQLKMSPAIKVGNLIFLTGVTGSNPDGQMPEDAEMQMRNAFEKIGHVLREAGLTFGSMVEMTSYHMDVRAHFDLFDAVRLDYVKEPFPAWTAVGVAALRREGAIVEIRVVASADGDT